MIRGSPLESKLLECCDFPFTPLAYHVTDGICVVSLGAASVGLVSAWGTLIEEHRVQPRLILALFDALETAENDPAVQSLVVSAEGRFWCNGFDLKWIQGHLHLADIMQQSFELLCARGTTCI